MTTYKDYFVVAEEACLEGSIENYERGKQRKVSKKQPMADIADMLTYEWEKFCLDMIHKDKDLYWEKKNRGDLHWLFYEWPLIRQKVSCLVSGGRTLKVTELTNEELIKARKMAEEFGMECIEKKKQEWVV